MKKNFITFLTLFLVGIGFAVAQTQVHGTVLDENGNPAVGATIQVKGTLKGIYSDNNGKFTLQAPQNGTLIVSYIGYKTQEIAVAPNVTVKLEVDANLVQELVVTTAMGLKRSEKAIGYATQELKSEELDRTRQTDLNNAIVGKVSGVRFVGGSGAKFDSGSIFLRGTNFLSDAYGSEPIYVVDGVITNPNSINMDDVSSINVLKGPSATSMYGSRGGNGAIIITTKSIGEGKSQVNFSHTVSIEKVYTHVKVQKEYGGGYGGANEELPKFEYEDWMPDYLKQFDGRLMYDYADDSSWGPKFNGQKYMPWYAWDPTDPRFGQETEWKFGMNIKDLFRTGVTNTTNVSFARAGKDYNTRISFTNVDRRGVKYNSDANRKYLSIKSQFNVTDRLKVSLDYKYTYRKNHNAAVEGYNVFGEFIQSYLMWGNTNVNLKDLKNNYQRPDGTFRTWNINDPTDLSAAFHQNPYALMNEVNRSVTSQWNVFSGNIEYTIPYLEKLKVGGNINGNLRTTIEENKIPMNLGTTSRYDQSQNSMHEIQAQAYAKYEDKFFDNRLTLDAAVFGETDIYSMKGISAFTRDGLFINSNYWNVSNSVGKPGGSSNLLQTHTRSVFGTATLGFDDTYFIDMNLRNDWSSTLPEDKNSYKYGGVSASIIMNKFFKLDWLNFWKIRTSFAQVGSTMSAYNVNPVVLFGPRYGDLISMVNETTIRNPKIKPTISTSYEFGTEFRVLKNRLWGDINFYNKDSKDQILDRNITPATGYSFKTINVGIIRNHGVEITLGGIPVKTKDFQWTLNFNISKNKNKLVRLEKHETDPTNNSYQIFWTKFSVPISINAIKGQPIGVIEGNDWLRDKNGNMILGQLPKGSDLGDVRPYVDRSAQGLNKNLGNCQPKFTGGASTSLSYKGITLSAVIDFQKGGQLVSWTNLWAHGSGILKETAGLNDRGKPLRDPVANGGGVFLKGVDKNGKPLQGYIDATSYYQDMYPQVWKPSVYNTSYVKLREVSLGYDIPKSILKKMGIGINAASIAFVAQNPWLIHSATPNIDPSEISGSNRGYIEEGQTVSTRTYGFTINITF